MVWVAQLGLGWFEAFGGVRLCGEVGCVSGRAVEGGSIGGGAAPLFMG